ncbi:hypothetical protein ACWCPQ_17420 [Nocardia sp. NPDC001965]
MSSFSKWDREGYRRRVGEEEAARRRRSIMAEQWGYQLAEERKRLGFTQAGLAEIMGGPGRASQIEHGEVATVEAPGRALNGPSQVGAGSRSASSTTEQAGERQTRDR